MRQVVDSVSGTVSHDYDLLDRLTVETTPEGSVSYTYFADGRRQTMTVAGQPVVTYGYDDAHRLTSITQGESIVSLTYDNADRRSTLTLPNGIVATYGYDDADRLTALTYTLGPATVGTLTYAYDAGGNRTTVGGTWARTGLPQALSDATYDAANRIATWAGQSFSYDANGNLASDGLTSYNWNARNQLAGLSGATSASFEYDGLGRRRAKSVSGVSTGFLYDGLNMVQELTLGSPSANILPGVAVDEWLLRTDAAGTRHFLPGSLGSTAALADDLGTVQTEYTFEPFGNSAVSGSVGECVRIYGTRRRRHGPAVLSRPLLRSVATTLPERRPDWFRRRRRQSVLVYIQQSDKLHRPYRRNRARAPRADHHAMPEGSRHGYRHVAPGTNTHRSQEPGYRRVAQNGRVRVLVGRAESVRPHWRSDADGQKDWARPDEARFRAPTSQRRSSFAGEVASKSRATSRRAHRENSAGNRVRWPNKFDGA